MNVVILSPTTNKPERSYVYHTIFAEFLGLDYKIQYQNSSDIVLKIGEKKLVNPDIFFSLVSKNWLEPGAIDLPPSPYYFTHPDPAQPDLVPSWFAKSESGASTLQPTLSSLIEGAELNTFRIDLIGSIFFLLTRYEEAISDKRDIHGRFQVVDSVLYQDSLYKRPLVNEYLSILKYALKTLNPNLQFAENNFKQIISCDVDLLKFPPVNSPWSGILYLASQAVKSRSLVNPIKNIFWILVGFFGGYKFDRYNTFKELVKRANETKSTLVIYLMSGDTNNTLDGNYSLTDQRLVGAIKDLKGAANLRFGLHGSYDSYANPGELLRQKEVVESFLEQQGIPGQLDHSRQHYLRWDSLVTANAVASAGIVYDSTLTFAESGGFRTSCCIPHSMYDLVKRQPLRLKQIPLILMDGSLLQPKYLGLDSIQSALDYVWDLKNQCIKHSGVFTILWHNSSLSTDFERQIFYGATDCPSSLEQRPQS